MYSKSVSPEFLNNSQIEVFLANWEVVFEQVFEENLAINLDPEKLMYRGSSIETVAFQVYEILKIDHEFLQFF